MDVEPRRGRPSVWQPLRDGFDIHPDGRVRDRHRHIVTDPFLLDWLLGEQQSKVASEYRLACGHSWPADDDYGARRHWVNCLESMISESPGASPGRVSRKRSDSGTFVRNVDPRPSRSVARVMTGDFVVILDHSQPDPFRKVRGDTHIHTPCET